MISAFGIEHEIAKAGPRMITGVVREVGHGIGEGARDAGKAGRRARNIRTPGPTRRAEFDRGFRGGARGGKLIAEAGVFNGRRGVRGARRLYRQQLNNAAAGAGHRRSFTAGARTGRAAGAAAAHPVETVYGLGAAGLAGAIANDIRRERRNRVRKGAAHEAALVAGSVGATAGIVGGINEAIRRHYNRKGANVSVKQQYLHPYRTQYQQSAAVARHRAGKLSARAAQTTDPKKAARLKQRANRDNWSSQSNNEAAKKGGIASYAVNPDLRRYDKTRTYTAPKTIGKSDRTSAFGIEH